MINKLKEISLKELKAIGNNKKWEIETYIKKIQSTKPIKGNLSIEILDKLLKVKGDIKGDIKINCDRCQEDFIHELQVNIEEVIWIGKNFPKEEASVGIEIYDLMECIDPNGYFDPKAWIFEQLHLQLPLVKICSSKCPGSAHLISEANKNVYIDQSHEGETQFDSRWSKLKKLIKK